MRPSAIAGLLVLTAWCVGCGPPIAIGSPAGTASTSPPTVERVPLPSGFPVPSGAVPEAMPDSDPGLVGLWSTDAQGSAAYDFYVTALPAAGFEIVGLYPGGEFAIIRFRLPDGENWQVVAHDGEGGRVAIEVRLDRP